MSSKQSSMLSNPFSSGSGGPVFEMKVQAGFVALMLCEGVCPCLHEAWPIERIALQTKYRGMNTDDFLVVTRNDNTGDEAKLLVQVKHSVAFNLSDPQLPNVLRFAWSDFKNNRLFKTGYDAITLVTGPLSKTDTEDVCALLALAREAEDSRDFFTKMKLAEFCGQPQRDKFSILIHHLTNANGGMRPSEQDTFNFLKHFYLLGFDMDLVAGICVSLFQSIIGRATEDSVKDVWRHIVEVVQHKNPRAGGITMENIDPSLKRRFKIKDKLTPVTRLAMGQSVSLSQPGPIKETLALNLIGAWDENAEGDRSIVEALSGMAFPNWQAKVREIWKEQGQ